jgi:hypothetical protein
MTRRIAIFLACAVVAGCIGYYFYGLIAQDSLRHRNYLARYLVDANESAVAFAVLDEDDVVIPGRAKREPGIHTPGRGHGFRACAKWSIPE